MEQEVKTLKQLKRSRAANIGAVTKNGAKIEDLLLSKVQAGTFSAADLDTANILETSENRRNLVRAVNEQFIEKTDDSDEAVAKEVDDSNDMLFRTQAKEL